MELYHVFLATCALYFAFFGWSSNATQTLELKACGIDAIYQFGDSLSDTGNSIIEVPPVYHHHLPYGESIENVTGRTSDGLLMVDYISRSADLPYTQPYENPNSTFPGGPNFAVAGVTALPKETLAQWNLASQFTNSSLNVQLGWFENYLKTRVCQDNDECSKKLESALFMLGSIGSNDYTIFILGTNMTNQEIKMNIVPLVINAIRNGVTEVIEYGAKRVIVPGTYPMGCCPSYIQTFHDSNSTLTFDKHGCIKELNELYSYHNDQVKEMVENIKQEYPNVYIAYADIYDAHVYIINNLGELGYEYLTIGCCGTGPNRASNALKELCGAPGVFVCPDPSKYVFFDGMHPSHKTNGIVTEILIQQIVPELGCSA